STHASMLFKSLIVSLSLLTQVYATPICLACAEQDPCAVLVGINATETTVQHVSDCYKSIGFNSLHTTTTLDSLYSLYNDFFIFRDAALTPDLALLFTSKPVDVLAELEKIRQTEYTSDFDFHSDLTALAHFYTTNKSPTLLIATTPSCFNENKLDPKYLLPMTESEALSLHRRELHPQEYVEKQKSVMTRRTDRGTAPSLPDLPDAVFVAGEVTAAYQLKSKPNVGVLVVPTMGPWTNDASKIVILTDGQCGSACGMVNEHFVREHGVKAVAVGGHVDKGLPMLSFAGAAVLGLNDIAGAFERLSVLPTLARLPYKSTVNIAAIELYSGNDTIPLEYNSERYVAALRLDYTPETARNHDLLWGAVADTAWS
ncbi:hypothetical protein KVV02_004782, partial [Mortierella alpina]